MVSLWRKRKIEHSHDVKVRAETAATLLEHRATSKKVRDILERADETLAEEIRRLDAAIESR